MTITERHAMQHELDYIVRSLAYTASRSTAEGVTEPNSDVIEARARARELRQLLAKPETSNRRNRNGTITGS